MLIMLTEGLQFFAGLIIMSKGHKRNWTKQRGNRAWEVFTIKLVICDDDLHSLDEVRHQIMQWSDQNKISVQIRTCRDGDQLLESCLQEKTDVILLDIMMPLLNGMDVAREIRKTDSLVKIIFVTSSSEFAVESYEVKASGYLLKPIRYEKLCELLNDCVDALRREHDTIIIRTEFGYQSIYTNTIECVEAQNKKVVFHLSDGSRRGTLNTLSHYEKVLSSEKGFFKCHRSYIVYIPAIDHFTAAEILTRSGMRIPIARSQRQPFQHAYLAYMFKEERSGF